MKWSFPLGTIAGIRIQVHATFVILIVWVLLSRWAEGGGLGPALAGTGLLLGVFGCVVLHELGHALTARRFGIRTRDITLLPIGGVARMERIPADPWQELWVALAGPAVNLLIAALTWGALKATGAWVPIAAGTEMELPFFTQLMLINVALFVFNLLPAFPMDGGRVLRALLATRLEYNHATRIAASIGQAMALLFGLLGLVGNPFLLFTALFVWIGAQHEAQMAQVHHAFGSLPVERAMLTEFHTLTPDETLLRAAQLLLAGSQQDFPVLHDGRLVGVLTRRSLFTAIMAGGRDRPVSEAMDQDVHTADAHELLETAFARLGECECRIMPVLRDGRLVGLLTAENVGEFVMIESALRRTEHRKRPGRSGHR